MIPLLLLISGVCAGWSAAPQAYAFIATPTTTGTSPSYLAKRGPVTSLCAFESDEEEGSANDTSTNDIFGYSLLSGVAASVGTTLLAAIASALRNDDGRKDGTTNINNQFGTINRRTSIQNMANTALSITAGNLALGGVMAATTSAATGTATAAAASSGGAAAVYERTLSLGASGVASKDLLAWIAKKKAEGLSPELMAWFAAQKRLQFVHGVETAVAGVVTRSGLSKAIAAGGGEGAAAAAAAAEVEAVAVSSGAVAEGGSLANALAATAVVSKTLSDNEQEKHPTDEVESEEEDSDTIPVIKCKYDESLTDAVDQQRDEVE